MGLHHYWRKRDDMRGALSLCGLYLKLEYLSEPGIGFRCPHCRFMFDCGKDLKHIAEVS